MTDPIKAEPVLYQFTAPDGHTEQGYLPLSRSDKKHGWTETPLYTHAQLVEERRLVWNEAIEAAANAYETGIGYAPGKLAAKRIRALSVPAIVEAGDETR